MSKAQLVAHLRQILDGDLDDVLQGDYDERNTILSEFEDVIDKIEAYKC